MLSLLLLLLLLDDVPLPSRATIGRHLGSPVEILDRQIFVICVGDLALAKTWLVLVAKGFEGGALGPARAAVLRRVAC